MRLDKTTTIAIITVAIIIAQRGIESHTRLINYKFQPPIRNTNIFLKCLRKKPKQKRKQSQIEKQNN